MAFGVMLCILLLTPLSTASDINPSGKNLMFEKNCVLVHVVRPGQNLGRIAAWYGSSPKEIKLLNGLHGDTIVPKQRLTILSKPHTVVASWYGQAFQGRPMASGKIFLKQEIVAAHKRLPLGSLVQIYNPKTGATLIVPILDRGPYIPGRDYDLSEGTAKVLGTVKPGVVRLVAQVVSTPH